MGTPAGRQETGSGRAQRADARANRGRILDVAEEVFGRGGESASTEEVARLAGVGIGTVFRHFPTKAALLEAVLVRRFDRLREQAEALLDAADPGEAFFGLFSHLAAHAAAMIAITEALLDAGGDRDGDAAGHRTDCAGRSARCSGRPSRPAPSGTTSSCPRSTPCSSAPRAPPAHWPAAILTPSRAPGSYARARRNRSPAAVWLAAGRAGECDRGRQRPHDRREFSFGPGGEQPGGGV